MSVRWLILLYRTYSENKVSCFTFNFLNWIKTKSSKNSSLFQKSKKQSNLLLIKQKKLLFTTLIKFKHNFRILITWIPKARRKQSHFVFWNNPEYCIETIKTIKTIKFTGFEREKKYNENNNRQVDSNF